MANRKSFLSPVRAGASALVLLFGLWGGTALADGPATSVAQTQKQTPPTPAPPKLTAAASADAGPTDEEIYADLKLFGEVFDRIRSEYVDKPSEKDLIKAAVQGMLTSLDPHSRYLDPTSFEDVREDNSGSFGGLGITVTMENGIIKVVSPIDDTPAQKAGILPNDLIVEIDGKAVQGMTLDEAVDMMKGPVGTDISLLVVRDGVPDPITFKLTRDKIQLKVVHWSVDKDVGVIRLSRFSEQAYSGIKDAIDGILKDVGGKPKGIILDLRNDPGGLLKEAVDVADAFLDKGAIVITRGRDDRDSARYDAKPDALDKSIAGVPMIVLINGGSASASEILAGALQDQKRATLLGTRSFGKGSVQAIIPLENGGAMQLTTARYYTPSNRSIQAAGIDPDIKVLQDVPKELQGRDEIIGEAGLKGQIGGGTEAEATTGSSVYVPADKSKDTQLNEAIKLILGEDTNPAFPPKPGESAKG